MSVRRVRLDATSATVRETLQQLADQVNAGQVLVREMKFDATPSVKPDLDGPTAYAVVAPELVTLTLVYEHVRVAPVRRSRC